MALSAGGVRGFAHVGVLEVLDNAGLPIDSMAGTSMGSVVGALYSAGVPTSKLWEISRHMTLQKITPDLNVGGLLRFLLARQLPSSSNMENFLNEQLGEMRFEDMQIPFSCAAMDAKTGERVLFNSGPLAIAVRASMNLPGIFAPVEYRHRQLVDGAVVDYLPTETLRNMGADYIIASVTPPDFSSDAPPIYCRLLFARGGCTRRGNDRRILQKGRFCNYQPGVKHFHLGTKQTAASGRGGAQSRHSGIACLAGRFTLKNGAVCI